MSKQKDRQAGTQAQGRAGTPMGMRSLLGTSLVLQPRTAWLRPSLTGKSYPSPSSQTVMCYLGQVIEPLWSLSFLIRESDRWPPPCQLPGLWEEVDEIVETEAGGT